MFVHNAIYFLQNRSMSSWYLELAGAMALSVLNRKNTPAVGIAKIPTMLGPTFVLGRGDVGADRNFTGPKCGSPNSVSPDIRGLWLTTSFWPGQYLTYGWFLTTPNWLGRGGG